MKNIFHPLLLTAMLCSALSAAEDCSKAADACSGGSLKSSPFVAASLRENLPPAPAPAKKKRAIMREAPPAAAAPALKDPAPALQEEVPAVPDAKQPLSSPLWLFFVGGVLAVLYLYLSAGRRKAGRR